MVGVGKIYEDFHGGVLQDDDEVALLHGPEEVGFIALTEPMVNVRATVERAVAERVIDGDIGALIADAAKRLFYKHRSFDMILGRSAIRCDDGGAGLLAWFDRSRVDPKRQDAMALLERITADNAVV
jgi:hypothetical protein